MTNNKLRLGLAAGFLAASSLLPTNALSSTDIPSQPLVLFDPIARQQVIANMPSKYAHRICPVRPVCAYEPVQSINGDERASGQTLAQQGRAVWFAVSRFLRDGEHRALSDIRAVLLDWARKDAAHRLEGRPTRARHYMKLGFLPMITAYAVLKQAGGLPPREVDLIETWMARVVDAIDQNNLDGKRLSDAYNSRYSRDLVNMTWGALTGDFGAFEKGLVRFDAALDDMREDGSLPGETMRKSYALSYQNLAISILVAMAEVAAVQGIDLYTRDREGRSLHLAIAFLVNAAEDFDMVRIYADLPQDLSRLRNHLSWSEAYLARFPDHPNAEALRRLRERSYFTSGAMDGFSGGNFSCLFADPETNPLMTKRPPVAKDIVPGVSRRFAKVQCPRYLE